MWEIVYSKQAIKDSKRIIESKLENRVKKLISILETDPFQTEPPYEKLIGDLSGAYSRRINIQHRLVYQVFIKEKTVRILRMWNTLRIKKIANNCFKLSRFFVTLFARRLRKKCANRFAVEASSLSQC